MTLGSGPGRWLKRCAWRKWPSVARPLTIETPERYMIEWSMTFRIDGDAFIYLDSAGREQTIVGYPTAEICHAMWRGKAS